MRKYRKVSFSFINKLELQDGRIRAMEELDTQIENISGITKLRGQIKEAIRDQALSPDKRRERKKYPNGEFETPWPRQYLIEVKTRLDKIEVISENAEKQQYAKRIRERIRIIQHQFDYFEALVEMLNDVQTQECPICFEEKVTIKFNAKGRGRTCVSVVLWTFYVR